MKRRLRLPRRRRKPRLLVGAPPVHVRSPTTDGFGRARRTLDPFAAPPAPVRRQDRPSKPDGLTKQTYSTHVHTRRGEQPRKWHVVAYFSVRRCRHGAHEVHILTDLQGDDYARLPVVENYEYLRNIRVPEGIFTSAKGNIARFGRVLEDSDGQEVPHAGRDYHDWTPAPWALASSASRGAPTVDRPMSSSSSSSSSATLRTSSQYSVGQHRPSSATGTLPRLATVVPVGPLTPPASPIYPTSPRSGASNYKPLTAEDRRALNSFRLAL